MYRRCALVLGLIMATGVLSGCETPPVQLSLWNPIQVFSEDTDVYGLRVNGFYTKNQDVYGLDIGAGLNKCRDMTGLQTTLFCGGNLGYLRGVQFSALVSASREVLGAQVSGLAVGSGGVRGVQIAGGTSDAAYEVTGLQVAGLFSSVHSSRFAGLQIAGLCATVGGDWNAGSQDPNGEARGMQTGLGCESYCEFSGLQFGLLSTHCARTVRGVQIGGIYNEAAKSRALQVGIINYSHELHGVQIGLINLSKNGGFRFCPIINSTLFSPPEKVGMICPPPGDKP